MRTPPCHVMPCIDAAIISIYFTPPFSRFIRQILFSLFSFAFMPIFRRQRRQHYFVFRRHFAAMLSPLILFHALMPFSPPCNAARRLPLFSAFQPPYAMILFSLILFFIFFGHATPFRRRHFRHGASFSPPFSPLMPPFSLFSLH